MEEETKPENLGIVDDAKKQVAELRAENDRREKLLEEEKKLLAEKMLGGTAGGRVEPVVKEETPQEYAARILKNQVTK
jgi:hypothetical protein